MACSIGSVSEAVRRQEQERDALGRRAARRAVPARSVEPERDKCAGLRGRAELRQEFVHRLRVRRFGHPDDAAVAGRAGRTGP